MLYLLSFFCSPLALLLAGKPFQALFNGVVYILSFIGLLLFFIPGLILWGVGAAHAVIVIHNKRADQRAERLADALRREQR